MFKKLNRTPDDVASGRRFNNKKALERVYTISASVISNRIYRHVNRLFIDLFG